MADGAWPGVGVGDNGGAMGGWWPPAEPVDFTVSTARRVGFGITFAVLAVFLIVLFGIVGSRGVSTDVTTTLVVGMLLIVAALGLVYWMLCRARIRFAGWRVTAVSGGSPEVTFDARQVRRIRLRRSRSSTFHVVWVDDPRAGRRRVVVPTGMWGTRGPAAEHLLRLVAHGAPGVRADRGTERALDTLRGTAR